MSSILRIRMLFLLFLSLVFLLAAAFGFSLAAAFRFIVVASRNELTNGINFSPDGSKIAVPSLAGIRIFNVAQGNVILTLPATRKSFSVFSENDRLLASTYGNEVLLVDLSTNMITGRINPITPSEFMLNFSPDSKYIVMDSTSSYTTRMIDITNSFKLDLKSMPVDGVQYLFVLYDKRMENWLWGVNLINEYEVLPFYELEFRPLYSGEIISKREISFKIEKKGKMTLLISLVTYVVVMILSLFSEDLV